MATKLVLENFEEEERRGELKRKPLAEQLMQLEKVRVRSEREREAARWEAEREAGAGETTEERAQGAAISDCSSSSRVRRELCDLSPLWFLNSGGGIEREISEIRSDCLQWTTGKGLFLLNPNAI